MPGIKEKLGRYLIPGIILVSSLTFLVVGVPRFTHELALVSGTPVLERINAGDQVSGQELTLLEQSRLDALEFVKLPAVYTNLDYS